MCRSEQNSNLGLEVQLHIPDILVPALSEPGMHLTPVFIITFLFVISSSIQCDGICLSDIVMGLSDKQIFLINPRTFQVRCKCLGLEY
jgi:hypothetical protein